MAWSLHSFISVIMLLEAFSSNWCTIGATSTTIMEVAPEQEEARVGNVKGQVSHSFIFFFYLIMDF